MEEVKLSGKSKNIISENILKMMKIFPEVVVDNKINFEKLKFLLGEDIEESNERFMFTWPGKAKAVNSIKIPTTGTLRPCKDESINWDTTKNLYIKGNNIDVLKLLQKGYYKKVKAIYIDVPYNAGQDIIYKNDYKDSIDNYLKITGQRVIKDGETVNVINNTESNGRYHSNWLCEMYPCLDIAKELLDDEGIIFIAIDDHEFSNLKQITDDIFNEINYIGTLVTKCNPQGRGKKNLDPIHEYHLIYAKNINLIAELKLERNNEDNEIEYQNFRRSGTNSRKYERPNRFYPMLVKENKVSVITQEEYYKIYDGNNFNENHLGYLKDKYEKLGYQVIFPIAKNGEEKVWQREYKRAAKECNTYIYEGENIKTPKSDFETPKSLWYEPEHSNVEYGTNLLKKLFDGQKTFEYPKSIHTVKELISMTNEGIILDFFAGSSTTAHAVMQLNAENDTNYQYIMVQIPAIIGEDENAYALGYRNICQVGIDRIKKAGKEIEKENPQVDIGFKVLSLFFIDKVANYRTYDENGNIIKGEYAKIFEKQYNILIKKDKYASLLNNDFIENPEKAHNGYFSIDSKGKNKGRFKDSKTGKSTDDGNTFNLIMKDKEKLLSLDNPLRFIFSHSALKEGWDNPNVFQICTLNESIETIKKRQEIGRGLRLCVNQDGERIKDPKTNILTIMANESYESFAKSLQSEFEEETGIKFGFLRKNSFVNIPFLNEKGDVKKLNEIGSEKLFNYLFENEYIKADGIIQDKLLNEIDNGTLLDEYTINIKDKVIEIINKHINKYKINNANKKCRVKVNDEIYNSKSFIKFWELIKFKSTYSIKLDSSDFIKKCSLRISENLEIPDAKIIYTEYDLSIDSSGVNISENGVVRDLEIEYGKVKLPNILKYLQNNTPLTKRTIVKILKDSNTVNKFKKNPYEYQNRVCDIINSELNNQLIKGIEYFKLDSFYPRERFKNEEYEDYIDNLIPSECSIYNYINLDKLDSNVEREFAKSLEINDEVKMFTKLPFWFKISTPVGNYNPDWAILYEKDLHFIVETKGSVEYKDKYSSNRVNEDNKIACGRKHFETIAPNVKFIITNNYKNLVKNL